MNQIILPFRFPYKSDKGLETLELDLYGDFFPLRPVFTSMGMAWKKVIGRFGGSEYLRHINLGSGYPAICADVEGFLKIASQINPNRVRNKETFLYFVKFLPATVEEFLRESKPKPSPDDLKPMYETDVREIPAEEIIMYRRLEPRDVYRKELPSVGVKDPAEIDFLCGAYHAQLYKPNPENPTGEPLRRMFPIDSYKTGQLREYARGGFYLRPEYFRRFPHLYKYCTTLEREVIRQPDGKIIDMKRYVKVPEGGAPWYTREFANKMSDLVLLNQRVKEAEDRKRVADLVNSGEDYDFLALLNESLEGVLDEDFFNEYGMDDE